jgi:gamma-glutamylcyclotransferase (GGCT)/AIG2-like uncharacterized protein YtfP
LPLLFVYGSLKRGFRLHRHLRPASFRGAARTTPGYALYRLVWYPAMVAEPGSGEVTGELYEVPEDLIPVLDEVEGVPHLYQRVRIRVSCPDHSPHEVEACTYLYQQPVEQRARVEDGYWREEGQ